MATLPETIPTTNAGDGDRGTTAPVRTFTKTQATSFSDPRLLTNPTGGINSFTGEALKGVAPTSAGVGQYDDATGGAGTNVNQAPSDDAGSTYGGATQDEYESLTAALQKQKTQTGSFATDGSNQKVTPKPNVLDTFSSYTYRASWYLMTPEQYSQLVFSKKKNINGYQLLIQSGGAPQNSGGFKGALSTTNVSLPDANAADAGRNPAFPLDFYIDSITIENFLAGSGASAPHAVKSLKFTVVENNGITLLDRLYEAVQDFLPASGQKDGINYSAAIYLMVIKFYGYDEQGNLVTGIGGNKSDPNSVIEKFIPFKISQCNWSVENKLVTYNFEAKSPGEGSATGTRRGTIPYNIELTASTIGELLGQDTIFSSTQAAAATPGASTTSTSFVNPVLQGEFGEERTYPPTDELGQPLYASTTPPAKADAVPTSKTSITQGLMGAMNQFQIDLVKKGVYEKADVYQIVFANPGPAGGGNAIKNARLIPPGTKVPKSQTSTGPSVAEDPDVASVNKTINDIKSRNYAITAGMQLVQAIEIAIRNSTFVTDQNVLFYNEDDALQVKNAANKKDVVWFNITFESVPMEYDNKRNDYAQKITFIINTYTPINFSSSYYPINKFNGLQKQYNYWFTGKNNSVIEYKETMNNLYNLTISGDQTQDNLGFLQKKSFTSSMRDQPFLAFQTASLENSAGDAGKQNEAQANMAETLYDPTGLATCHLKIVGDPAWIQQGAYAGGVSAQEFDFNPFLPDGTINFDAREVLFEIAWQRPEDYDLTTGLADPYARSSRRQPVQSRVYTAMQCTSEFNKGSFYQTIQGKLYFFEKPNATNKAATSPAAGSTTYYENDGTTSTSTNPSAANAAAAAAGASGRPTAMSVPNVSAGPGSGTPGVFNSAPPGPKDTVAPASPPAPATAGTGGQVLTAPATVQSTLPIVRSPRQQDQLNGFANNPVTPQDMSRDF